MMSGADDADNTVMGEAAMGEEMEDPAEEESLANMVAMAEDQLQQARGRICLS